MEYKPRKTKNKKKRRKIQMKNFLSKLVECNFFLLSRTLTKKKSFLSVGKNKLVSTESMEKGVSKHFLGLYKRERYKQQVLQGIYLGNGRTNSLLKKTIQNKCINNESFVTV